MSLKMNGVKLLKLQLMKSEGLSGQEFVKSILDLLQSYSNSLDDVSSRELEDLITSCNMKVQTEKSLIESSYAGVTYGQVIAGLFSLLVDKKLSDIKDDDEQTLPKINAVCSRLFFVLGGDNVEYVPEVMLGNTEDITDAHIRLAVLVLQKLSSASHSWTPIGYTKFMLLCKHTRKNCKRLSMSKSQIQKLMLKASVPQDYVKFVKQFNDELYELLTVNENRVGWILYSEVKENDLYAIIDSACKPGASRGEKTEAEISQGVEEQTYDSIISDGELAAMDNDVVEVPEQVETFFIDTGTAMDDEASGIDSDDAEPSPANPAAMFNTSANPVRSADDAGGDGSDDTADGSECQEGKLKTRKRHQELPATKKKGTKRVKKTRRSVVSNKPDESSDVPDDSADVEKSTAVNGHSGLHQVGDAGEDERELSSDVISLSAAAEDSENSLSFVKSEPLDEEYKQRREARKRSLRGRKQPVVCDISDGETEKSVENVGSIPTVTQKADEAVSADTSQDTVEGTANAKNEELDEAERSLSTEEPNPKKTRQTRRKSMKKSKQVMIATPTKSKDGGDGDASESANTAGENDKEGSNGPASLAQDAVSSSPMPTSSPAILPNVQLKSLQSGECAEKTDVDLASSISMFSDVDSASFVPETEESANVGQSDYKSSAAHEVVSITSSCENSIPSSPVHAQLSANDESGKADSDGADSQADSDIRMICPTTPKPTTPKSTTPKSTTPKSTTPKSTTPKSTTPKSTTPKSARTKLTTPKSASTKAASRTPSSRRNRGDNDVAAFSKEKILEQIIGEHLEVAVDQTHEGVRTVEPYSQGKEKITPITQQDNQPELVLLSDSSATEPTDLDLKVSSADSSLTQLNGSKVASPHASGAEVETEEMSPVCRRTRRRQTSQSSDTTTASLADFVDGAQPRRSQRRRNAPSSNQSSPASTVGKECVSETDEESVASVSKRSTTRAAVQTPVQTSIDVSGDELKTSRSSRTRRTPTQLLRSGGRSRSKKATPESDGSKVAASVGQDELPVIAEDGEEPVESGGRLTTRAGRSRGSRKLDMSDAESESVERSRSPRKLVDAETDAPSRRSRRVIQPRITDVIEVKPRTQTRRSGVRKTKPSDVESDNGTGAGEQESDAAISIPTVDLSDIVTTRRRRHDSSDSNATSVSSYSLRIRRSVQQPSPDSSISKSSRTRRSVR